MKVGFLYQKILLITTALTSSTVATTVATIAIVPSTDRLILTATMTTDLIMRYFMMI